MNEPKEEARRMVGKYERIITRGTYFSASTKKMQCKLCAINECDRIIEELKLCRKGSDAFLFIASRMEFYEKVRKEIELM